MKLAWATVFLVAAMGSLAAGQTTTAHRHRKVAMPGPTDPVPGQAGSKTPGNGSVTSQLNKQEKQTSNILAQAATKSAKPATLSGTDQREPRNQGMDFSYHVPKSSSPASRSSHMSTPKRNSGHQKNSSIR